MLLYAQLAVLAVLAFLNIWLGIDEGFYGAFFWWDSLTHFLGGLWLGFLAAWLLQKARKRPTVLASLSAALAVGIVWEIFEYYYGIGGSQFLPYWVDTMKDLAIDTAGGAVAGYIATRKKIVWPQ